MPTTLEVLRRKARNARNACNGSNTGNACNVSDSDMSPAAREAYEERLAICLESGVNLGVAETLAVRSAGRVRT